MARGKFEQPRHLNTNTNPNYRRTNGGQRPVNMRGNIPQVPQQDEVEMHRASGRKFKKSTKAAGIAIATCTVMAVSAISGIQLYKVHMDHEKQEKANNFISEYSQTGTFFCEIPKEVASEVTKDEMFMEGKYLEESILEQGLDFVKIGEDYFTEDGSDIVVVTVDSTTNQYVEPITYKLSNGETCALPPLGYEFDEVENKCVKTVTESKELIYKTGVAPTPNEEGIIPSGTENVTYHVTNVETKQTYTFEDIGKRNLYIDGQECTETKDDLEVRKLVLDPILSK